MTPKQMSKVRRGRPPKQSLKSYVVAEFVLGERLGIGNLNFSTLHLGRQVWQQR